MKKLSLSFLMVGLLLGAAQLDAAVSKSRGVRCAIPALRKRFNCNAEEISAGKKWLTGASIATAVAALAALVAGGMKLAQVRGAKQEPTLEKLRAEVIRVFNNRNIDRPSFQSAYDNLQKAFGGDIVKTQDYIIESLPAFKTEVLDKGWFLEGPL